MQEETRRCRSWWNGLVMFMGVVSKGADTNFLLRPPHLSVCTSRVVANGRIPGERVLSSVRRQHPSPLPHYPLKIPAQKYLSGIRISAITATSTSNP